MSDVVVFEQLATAGDAFIGIARLNAPNALNALSQDMIDLLLPQLRAWAADPKLAAVWLEGEGERALCAGGDIVKMYESMQPVGARNHFIEHYFATEYELDYLLHSFPKPVLCWAEGVVMGGGMGLMQGASMRLVTATSRLAMPEITIGLYPDVGGSWFLNRTPGHTGLFAGLTGVHLNAADALFMGLADHFIGVDRDQVKAALSALPLSGDGDADAQHLHDALVALRGDAPPSPVREQFDAINAACDAPTLQRVLDNILAQAERDKWWSRAAGTLAKGCPMTTHLVWEQLRRTRHMSLAEAFRFEWVMSVQCAMHADFREGVRALLIEKDGAPKFRHHTAAEVTAEEVAAMMVMPAPQHPLADL